ncbi:nitroreductase family protein [Candidatus Uabimicrobium amorphum]|uniref:Nitroreductase n=1 Tax=Uabimicrobium amorphum TaxID=2596890 RepID=A0A5S9ILG8_UABAM|nr:nitroreductase family protein [Candidatus Uabimicrobium amorphum]BBM82755.1 nitroreductase [Candidatus Uabimicrobium amorphum]
MTNHIEALREIIETRRSVRRFTDEEIPREVIEECLRLAILAPNSSNLQPWEFYVVSSENERKQLAAACFQQRAAKTAAVLIAVVGRSKSWKENAQKLLNEWPGDIPPAVESYYTKTVKLLYTQGPLGILGFARKIMMTVVGLFRPVPRGPFSKQGMQTWAAKTCALAAENLMLALKAHGYDSCPMEGFDEKRVRKILGYPSDAFTVMMIGAGKGAADGIYYPRMRFDSKHHVFEV